MSLVASLVFWKLFGSISVEFGPAVVLFLARRIQAKIPIKRPNESAMPPKRTKKVRLGIYRTQIGPSDYDIVTISGQ